MTKNTLNKKVNRVIYMLQDIKDALCNNNCEYCSFYTGVRDNTKIDKKNCLFVINTEKLTKAKEDY